MKRLKNLLVGALLLIAILIFDRSFKEEPMSDKRENEMSGMMWVVVVICYFLLFLFIGVTSGAQEVIISPKAKNSLQFLYFTIAERAGLEGAFCLNGFIDPTNKNVLIQSVTLMWIDSASTMNVAGHYDCTSESVGQLHFHPPGTICNFSDADIVWGRYTRPKTEAIYCRVGSDTIPGVLLLRLAQVDSIYNTLSFNGSGDGTLTRVYTAIYRYRRPP